MDKEYFISKWLNNELTEQQLKVYLSEEEIAYYKKILHYSDQLETPPFDKKAALDQIKLLKQKQNSKVRRLNPYRLIASVAAAFAIFFASYYFIANQQTSYETPYAEKASYNLPDGSVFTLNANSSVSYVKNNWEENRNLILKGEAFFKVEKGKTFSVNTALGVVKVLGTQFNVISRPDFFEVMCYEGLVSVTYNNKTRKLPAGNIFRVLKNKEIPQETFQAVQPSWIINKSTFKSMPYNHVLKEFERQFNVVIEINNINVDSLFTGSFIHTDKEQALKAISIPLNLSYKIVGNKVILYKDASE